MVRLDEYGVVMRPGDDMTTPEKWCYCELIEQGAHPVEAAAAMMVPWETVKRSLGVDPFFANRWAKSVRRGEFIEHEPQLVLELEKANPKLLQKVQALIAEADEVGPSGQCPDCGDSFQFRRPGEDAEDVRGDDDRNDCRDARHGQGAEITVLFPPPGS